MWDSGYAPESVEMYRSSANILFLLRIIENNSWIHGVGVRPVDLSWPPRSLTGSTYSGARCLSCCSDGLSPGLRHTYMTVIY